MAQQRDKAKQSREYKPQAEFDLSDREEKEVFQRIRPNAVVIHEVIRLEGESELRRSLSALGWSGLAAGLSMGLLSYGVFLQDG